MSTDSSSPPPSPAIVWWVLWGAFQIGIVLIYHFLGRAESGHSNEPAIWQAALLPVLISGALRWSLFPNIKDSARALPLFVVGIALAEMTCFLGLFVFTSHKLPLFIASFLGILQFIPVYAGRFGSPDPGP